MVVVAYLVSSVVAGAVVLITMLATSAGTAVFTLAAFEALLVPIVLASGVAAATALLPTVPVGLYAERHGKRRARWYASAGVGVGLAALVVYVAASELASRSVSNANLEDGKFLLALAACVMLAGACSGITYWSIAGRHAGRAAHAEAGPRSAAPTAQPPSH